VNTSVATVAPALLGDVIRDHGVARLRVSGSSMLPSIRPGDVLWIRRCSPPEIVPGQVVLVAHDDRLLAHRLVRVRDTGNGLLLTTRGDAHWHCDPEVSQSQMLGWIDAIERNDRVRRAPFRCTTLHRMLGLALNETLATFSAARRMMRVSII
jgi:signal peptidase I